MSTNLKISRDNCPQHSCLQYRCIHHLFEEQVQQRPQATAVVFESQQLTYADLNRRSNQIAHYLLSKGVKPDDLVGVFLDRSLEMLVAILGILKSGAAYVPMEPILPPERLAFMLEDAQVSMLLTHQQLLKQLPPYSDEVIFLEQWEIFTEESQENPSTAVTPENLAYVIYTSGSTGRPKGVMVQHAGVDNMVQAQVKFFNVRPESRILQFYSFVFDASIFETFMALLTGATLFLETRDTLMQGAALANLLREKRITSIQFPPSVLASLPDENLPDLEVVMVGGEVYSPDLIDRWAVGRRLFNVYGPTEITVWATVYERTDDRLKLPIGHPIPNTEIYILDANLQPVSRGESGEICISGVGVARGYLNRPELTLEKFIQNSFSSQPEARLYRTGDLGRYMSDGNIEFLGRIDRQVKIRGFRIELGEIEWVLQSHRSVREAAVVAREDETEDRQLIAYLVPQDKGVKLKELRSFLGKKLPAYMMPCGFVVLDEMPRTPNDKIDRNALPIPDEKQRKMEQNFIAPRNSMEKVLAKIWSEVLQISPVGIEDNFIELGGHSLKATRVVSQIREIVGIEVSLSKFFEAANLKELARYVESCLLDGSVKSTADASIISQRPELEKAPLSGAQQRLWLLQQQELDSTAYNIAFAYQIKGELNIKALEQSLQAIVNRHEILRTTFAMPTNRPVQIVKPDLTLKLPVLNLENLPLAEREVTKKQTIAQEAKYCFDLSKSDLVRCLLIRLNHNEHLLLIVMHHIVFDGWSVGIFSRELSTLYQAISFGKPTLLPKLPIQYADFAYWQHQQAKSERLSRQLSYWQKQLEGKLPVLELPADYPRPPIRTSIGERHRFKLSLSLFLRLKALAQHQSVTLFVLLLTAFKVLLYRYTGQEDLLVGTVNANRNRQELENLIGFFVNTLVLCTDLSGNPSFLELLNRVNQVTLAAYDNQELPFEKLVEAINPKRNLNHTPLFQVMFVLQNADMLALEIPGLDTKIFDIHNGTSKFDLQLELLEESDSLSASFEYSKNLFSAATIERMSEHFVTLLEDIVSCPKQHIGYLRLLSSQERHQVVVEWNNMVAKLPCQQCIHQLFEAQVERTPDATAVVFEEEQLSYQELNARANQLASYLQNFGVGPEMLVGICIERSIEMVVGLLGILKAGGAYVPLDPSYPQQRLQFMLRDAKVSVLVTQTLLLETLPDCDAQVVCLDRDWPFIAQLPSVNPHNEVTSDNLAYVIYTSGSTGRPKGVLIPHRNVIRLFGATQAIYNFNAQDCWTLFHSYAFDFSVWELWGALLHGGRLVVVPYWVSRSPKEFYDLLVHQQVTVLNQTPSAFRQLIQADADFPADSLKLRYVIFGGEALQMQSLIPWFERHGDKSPQLVNMYGITETTVHVTNRLLSKADLEQTSSPIGKALADLQIYILDNHLQPLPIGVPGELHIGGAGLARGYLNRPKLTTEKFIANPFGEGCLYKTGDLARYLLDGNIEYLGRLDHQVKIRGFRIELGEIEWALQCHRSIKEAVVVTTDDHSGQKQLVAYLVASPEGTNVKEVRSYLQEKLPEYFVPSLFVFLDSMPLTANGKLDRKALPSPYETQPERSEKYVMPRTPLEEKIAEIWRQVLGLEQVGIYDNFFELGGHSLLATRIIMLCREIFQTDLPVRCLFESPTVEMLARTVEVLRTEGPSALYSESPDLIAEAELETDIYPCGESGCNITSPSRIFLTGATGFLGAFLLCELLKKTSADVYCLVRASHPSKGLQRIQATLKKYSLPGKYFSERIKVIVGDLSQPLLGLEPEQFRYLAKTIDTIYHNGAWVNFIEPYSRLKPTNVLATKEIIKLACQSKVKPVHYIASSSVFGTVGYFKKIKVLKEEDDINLGLGYGFGGYVQSKWVAEKMVWNAKARGLPVTVFRCALVMGHSETGVSNTKDFLSRLIKNCIQLGSFYDLRNKFDNFVTVDFASQSIVHLSLKKQSIGKPFHIVNPHQIEYAKFWDLVCSCGYSLDKLSYGDWSKKMLEYVGNYRETPLYALIPLFIEKISPAQLTIVELFQDTPFYETTNVTEGLSDSSIVCPRIDKKLVSTWINYYIRMGFLNSPINSALNANHIQG